MTTTTKTNEQDMFPHYKGTYKNGKEEGPWVGYWKDGTVWELLTGTYRNGVKVGK